LTLGVETAKARRSFTANALRHLLRPIDVAWLAAFRVLYGVALAVSIWRFLAYGWVERFFVQPKFHFKYWGFEWIEPLSAAGMHALFVALLVLALCVALGVAFRLTSKAFALGLTYFQLIDVSTYLNHYYLAALLAVLLSVSPAQRAWSVDAWLSRRLSSWRSSRQSAESTVRRESEQAPLQIPAIWLWVFRFQIAVVYVFAGLAKAQPDWLIHAQPLRIWLSQSTSLPLVGWLFAWPETALILSWCGFLFDTTIVLFLLHRKSRIWAYAVVVVFHCMTRVLFPIGMFPVIMVLSALVFFSPSWPRELLRFVQKRWMRSTAASIVSSSEPHLPSEAPAALVASPWAKLGMLVAAAYCAGQLLLPVRWLAYPGNVLWHEQGMRFAWRVMLRAKGGSTNFVVRQESTGRVFHVSPRVYLNDLQESEMSGQPDLILQLAHHVARDFESRGLGPVSVRAESRVSLNGRRSAVLIDPRLDLVSQRDGLDPARFVLPAPNTPPPHTRSVL
jgi:hypothetical protein